MQTVIITIHLLVVIALVGVVLIQRSEGGGLGIGGGSGFMTARGAKNTLTRLTAVLAACFFLTSIILTVMQLVPNKNGAGIVDQASGSVSRGVLDQLGGPKAPAEGQNKGGNAAAPAEQNSAPQKAEQSSVADHKAAVPAENSAARSAGASDVQAAGSKTAAESESAKQPESK